MSTQNRILTPVLVCAVVLGACSPAIPTAEPQASTLAPSPVPPTWTPEPSATSTATAIPSPTPLPGSLVLPLDTLGQGIPWLPLDTASSPAVNYVGFNTVKPPFNSALVRRAFAYSVDRDVLVEMATRYRAVDAKPATTLTPPQTLGRDLYGVVGAGFDAQRAKGLLTEAGYTDPSSFPAVVFLVTASGDIAPGARFNMANAMAEMWETHLGVKVEVQAVQSSSQLRNRFETAPPDLFWLGWVADYNDPANFVGELFNPNGDYSGEFNRGGFANPEFADLVDRAAKAGDPAERQELYIRAERLLCETEAAVVPIFHSTYNIP